MPLFFRFHGKKFNYVGNKQYSIMIFLHNEGKHIFSERKSLQHVFAILKAFTCIHYFLNLQNEINVE